MSLNLLADIIISSLVMTHYPYKRKYTQIKLYKLQVQIHQNMSLNEYNVESAPFVTLGFTTNKKVLQMSRYKQ